MKLVNGISSVVIVMSEGAVFLSDSAFIGCHSSHSNLLKIELQEQGAALCLALVPARLKQADCYDIYDVA
jgi:precorrin-6B methylase 1